MTILIASSINVIFFIDVDGVNKVDVLIFIQSSIFHLIFEHGMSQKADPAIDGKLFPALCFDDSRVTLKDLHLTLDYSSDIQFIMMLEYDC